MHFILLVLIDKSFWSLPSWLASFCHLLLLLFLSTLHESGVLLYSNMCVISLRKFNFEVGEKRGLCFLAFSACVSIYLSTKQSIFTKKELVGWTKNLECHHWYKVGMCVDHINSSFDMLINFCTICWPEDRLYRQDKPWKSFKIWILDLFSFSFFSWSFGSSNMPKSQFADSNLVLWNFVP